jgi:hypothetical protein
VVGVWKEAIFADVQYCENTVSRKWEYGDLEFTSNKKVSSHESKTWKISKTKNYSSSHFIPSRMKTNSRFLFGLKK